MHRHFDYLQQGVRIACNPRGPVRADGVSGVPGFDPLRIVDSADGVRGAVDAEVALIRPQLTTLHDEVRELARRLDDPDGIIVLAIAEAMSSRAAGFDVQFHGLLQRLTDSLLIEVEWSNSDWIHLLQFGLPAPSADLGFDPLQYPPQIDLATLPERADRLIGAQNDCLALLPQLGMALDRHCALIRQRQRALEGVIARSDVAATLVPRMRLCRVWRHAYFHLGIVVVDVDDPFTLDRLAKLTDEALNPSRCTSQCRKFAVDIVARADYEEGGDCI